MKHERISLVLGSLLTGVLMVPSAANAQNALGAGDVLDANLNRQSGRRNQPSQRIDYRSRNLLITGDVAGGRGFRGTVGYQAADDFRGTLGEDTLFRFQADSALSSLGAIRNGNIIQDLRLGQDMGLLQYRRSARGTPIQNRMTNADGIGGDLLEARARLDSATLDRTSSLRLSRLTEPSTLGMALDAQGQSLILSASSLRGLTMTSQDEQNASPLNSFDRARVQEDARQGRVRSRLGLPSMNQLADRRVADTRLDASIGDDRRSTSSDDEYVNVLRRIAERYATSQNVDFDVQPELLVGLDAQFKQLRDQLAGRVKPTEDAKPGRPVERLRPRPETDPGTEPTTDPTTEPKADPVLPRPEPVLAPDGIARFGVILKHGERLQHYATDREDRFSELMRTAEERLVNTEYFWAERRFNRALRIMPDHPLAMAGVAHAQLGAGLYIPSALTLRRLLIRHPEMIDVQYAEAMLPNQERLFEAISKLQERVDNEVEVAPYGFLLAYLGHQLDDAKLIAEGFEFMATDTQDGAFIALLREIWIDK